MQLGSASCFCPEGEILKQVQDDKSQKFQISLARFTRLNPSLTKIPVPVLFLPPWREGGKYYG
jgi:hypothetical protein